MCAANPATAESCSSCTRQATGQVLVLQCCSAAGMMKMLRRIPSSQYSGFSPPGPASRPALCWGPCGVESGFYKVAVACLFTFTGCLHGCRFTHLLYHNFELFSCCACLGMHLYKAETSLFTAGGMVWWRLGGGSGCHSDSIIGVITTCTLHISSPPLLTSSNHLSIFCLSRNVYTRAQNRLI